MWLDNNKEKYWSVSFFINKTPKHLKACETES